MTNPFSSMISQLSSATSTPSELSPKQKQTLAACRTKAEAKATIQSYRRDTILLFLQRNGKSRTKAISQHLGLTTFPTIYTLQAMVELGLVVGRDAGGPKGYVWYARHGAGDVSGESDL